MNERISEGKQAMESKSLLLALTIVAVACMPGCSSQRPRLAWWKPTSIWGAKDEAETSALARSAPDLPSSKFEPMEPSSTAVAANTKPTTPAATRGALASAPSAKYPAPSSSGYVSPASNATDAPPATTSVASSAPSATTPDSGMAPQSSPYSNDNYTPANTASIAAANPAGQPQDRYAPIDRYAAPASEATPPLGSAPAFSPLASTQAPSNSSTDAANAASSPISSINPMTPAGQDRYERYDRYENSAVASATPTTAPPSAANSATPTPLPSASPVVPPATTVAQVAVPPTPGTYRPGGTSTYNATSAANIATRPANPEAATAYPAPRYQDPAQPTAPSSYGTPDRYR